MSINFKQLKEEAKVQKIKPLFAIILGASGSGKSSSVGTVGVPTLFLTTSTESHGVTAARATGGDVTHIDLTKYKKDNTLDADATLAYLHEILNSPGLSESFSAICIDSANDLQMLFRRSTANAVFCKTDKGTKNNFLEGEADSEQFRQTVLELNNLSSKGVHVFLTCAATIKTTGEAVMEATPNLLGFTTAVDLIRCFPDVFLVSRITEIDDETEVATSKHKFIFKSNISKTSKDLKGSVLKSVSFSPRVSGLVIDDLPDSLDVSFAKIIAAREKKFNKTAKA